MKKLLKFSAGCLAGLLIVTGALLWGHGAQASGEDAPGLANATILIVRHAEKPADGTGLNPQGQARADAYVPYFRHFAIDGRPVHIDTLIAAADTLKSARSRLTLTPFAQATGLPIQQPFFDHDVAQFAAWLGATRHGNTILIAWHHGQIANLVSALGGSPSRILTFGRWPGDMYDKVVVLRFDAHGHVIPDATQLVTENITV